MLRFPEFPRSVLLLQPLLAFLLMGGARVAWRSHIERRLDVGGGRPLLIVGSGTDAAGALRALKGAQRWRRVGILSPIASERGRALLGVRVLGGVEDLPAACDSTDAEAALVASPPGSQERRQVRACPC